MEVSHMHALLPLINRICNINFSNVSFARTTHLIRFINQKENLVRKSLVLSLAAMVLAVTACTHTAKAQQAPQAPQATYYRAWQGFMKAGLGQDQFVTEFPSFMQRTVDLYKGDLNNYIVVIPPATKPSYIPDEFALVALRDEASYRAHRATPEGVQYGEDHWTYFDKTTSKSATNTNVLSAELVSGTAYDLSGGPVDWSRGHTLFFLGTRKSGVSTTEFLARLREHVALASSVLKPQGMTGYIVIANDNYEAAFINWESKEAMERAFAQASGQNIGADARTFMDVMMWNEVTTLKGPLATGVYDSKGGF
jgi:hypothetical protein